MFCDGHLINWQEELGELCQFLSQWKREVLWGLSTASILHPTIELVPIFDLLSLPWNADLAWTNRCSLIPKGDVYHCCSSPRLQTWAIWCDGCDGTGTWGIYIQCHIEPGGILGKASDSLSDCSPLQGCCKDRPQWEGKALHATLNSLEEGWERNEPNKSNKYRRSSEAGIISSRSHSHQLQDIETEFPRIYDNSREWGWGKNCVNSYGFQAEWLPIKTISSGRRQDSDAPWVTVILLVVHPAFLWQLAECSSGRRIFNIIVVMLTVALIFSLLVLFKSAYFS